MKIINDYNEFVRLVGLDSLITDYKEVRKQRYEFMIDEEEHTVFTLCKGIGEPDYILRNASRKDAIGYYIVPGLFKLKGYYIEIK